MEKTLSDIEKECLEESSKLNLSVSFFQSNSESEIIEKIQSSNEFEGLIINAGALTHTSIAIHDALKSLKIRKVEVHISNIFEREDFRKNSFISPVVNGIITGFGTDVYLIALKSFNFGKNK